MRPIPLSATYWLYCDRHAPEGAELIPPDVEWQEVTVIAEVVIGAMATGQPGATVDQVVRKVLYALQDLGARASVVKTGATFRTGTASTGFRLQFESYGGGGGTPFSETSSNRPPRALVRRVDKKRGTG